MKTFLVKFDSEGNISDVKKRVIRAPNIREAQIIFLDWLKKQPLFDHMWRLKFEFEEVSE